jgi:methyltransferase (TIGR00027 family)
MMTVGQLRYIQTQFDTPDYLNPDTFVGFFLSPKERLLSSIRGKFFLNRVRANPFYHYVLARTRYYDEVFLDAIYSPVRYIINIGCGTDTRAYRFAHVLKQKGVAVIECDQPGAINSREEIARKTWPTEHVSYVPLDLNEAGWDSISQILDTKCQEPILVMMEGVSPYIRSDSFEAFLRFLATKLSRNSLIAYDYKVIDQASGFGESLIVKNPFRLPTGQQEVSSFHEKLGFHLRSMELSGPLTERILPGVPKRFNEDGLLVLGVGSAAL